MAAPPIDPPPAGTVERWAFDYVLSEELEFKLSPPPPPDIWESEPKARRLEAPGRPRELAQIASSPKTPRPGALRDPVKRAQLMHTFFHHELQAAELMCFCILAFPDTEAEFRRGVLSICLDEIRHANLYRTHILELGHRLGDFGVRDWFWERVPAVCNAAQYEAVMGLGFEGANLDHSRLFAQQFRSAGDPRGADIQDLIGEEEIPHVAFAWHWFERWSGTVSFENFLAALPPPLSPILMRGKTLNREARMKAGMDEAFMDSLFSYGRR